MTIGIILTCLLILCTTVFADNQFRQKEPVVYTLSSQADRYIASDIQQLVHNADYILIGKFDTFVEDWVMRTKPNYKEGEVYTFSTEDQLYGSSSEKINVVIPHFKRLTTVIDGKEYTADMIEPHYSKPEFEKKYILFLKKYKDVYVPSSVPFIIEIDADEQVSLKYNKNCSSKKIDISKHESLEIIDDHLEDFEKNDKVTDRNMSDILNSINESLEKKANTISN